MPTLDTVTSDPNPDEPEVHEDRREQIAQDLELLRQLMDCQTSMAFTTAQRAIAECAALLAAPDGPDVPNTPQARSARLDAEFQNIARLTAASTRLLEAQLRLHCAQNRPFQMHRDESTGATAADTRPAPAKKQFREKSVFE